MSGVPVASKLLATWPARALLRLLAPLLDRATRAWVFARRFAAPGLPAPGGGALAPLVRDELESGAPADKATLQGALEDWFAAKPEELEPLLERILGRTTPQGRLRIQEVVRRRAAARDEAGRAFLRELATAGDRATEAARGPLAELLAGDGSGHRLECVVDEALRLAPPAAKHRFFGWLEDRMSSDDHSLFYAERVFDWMRREVERHGGALAGARVLELGPGYTLATGLLFYAHGARSYAGADYYPIAGKESSVYRRLRAHLERQPLLVPAPIAAARAEALRRFDEAVALDGPDARFDESKVACRYPVDAAKLPFPDSSFDLVFSMASFEHFKDPIAAVRECARVTAPGGLNLHQIDFRDHRDFSKPLEFLRYDDAAWERLHTSFFYFTNRLRKSDFERIFTEAGLALARVDVTLAAPFDPALRSEFDGRFRDRPVTDFETLSALFAVKKP